MSTGKRCAYLFIAFGLSSLFFWLVTSGLSLSAQAASPAVLVRPALPVIVQPALAMDPPPDDNPIVLGEACGSGELLPDYILCLHGVVALAQPNGQTVALADVPVEVTLNGRVVSGTTFLHPGQTTPTYGLEISSLEPGFLQPVTLTAVISGTPIQRQVILFPNFTTQSQQFDLLLPAVGALDYGRLWGYVVEFSAGGPVTGAVVTAERNGLSVAVTTTYQLSESLPIYGLSDGDLAAIGATAGSLVTLTAAYGEDADRQVVVVGEEPAQVNFITGWKCDGFDPIPRGSGGEGVPRGSGGEGLPDVACFWGYGLFNSTPQSGIDVYLTISGTTYQATTALYPGETWSRYGIGLFGSQLISGTSITATAVYSGYQTTMSTTVQLDDNLSQRLDMAILQWERLTSDNSCLDSAGVGPITAAPDGSVWIGSVGACHYMPGMMPHWELFSTANSGLLSNSVTDIAIAPDGSIWFGTAAGLSHLIPGSPPQWETFTTANSDLADNLVTALALAVDGSLLVGTADGISYYMPGSVPELQTLPYLSGFVRQTAAAPDGSFWILGDINGLGHYVPGVDPFWEVIGANIEYPYNDIDFGSVGLTVAPDNHPWLAWSYGGSDFDPSPVWLDLIYYDGNWNGGSSYQLTNFGKGGQVYAFALAQDGSFWVGANYMPLIHLSPYNAVETFTDEEWLEGVATEISIGSDGSLWLTAGHGVSHVGRTAEYGDLSVSLQQISPAVAGQPVTYTLAVANYGAITLPVSTLTLTLPAGLTYVDASITPASIISLVWPIGPLAPGNQFDLTVRAFLTTTAPPGTVVTVTAQTGTVYAEEFLDNNGVQHQTTVLDPDQADLGVGVMGPVVLPADSQVSYRVDWINEGARPALSPTLNLEVSPGLTYHSASRLPIQVDPLVWSVDDLPAFSLPDYLIVTFTVASQPPDSLGVTVIMTTTTVDGDPLNNVATAVIPTSLSDACTLILVAPDRLAAHYGTSSVLSRIYEVARHPQVCGVVLNVLDDANVKAAYTAWDADPGNQTKANAVAAAIKALIDQYTIAYPGLRYLLIVGGDNIIPYYRVLDSTPPTWNERNYSQYIPPGSTVRSALAANQFLTDDFYADRTPTVPGSPLWTAEHPLFLPDFAAGRLVETPTEIIAAVDAFLAHDGVVSLEEALVGTHHYLTNDLGQAQCALLQASGMSAVCTESPLSFKESLLEQPFDFIGAAFHSHHWSLGSVQVANLATTDLLSSPALLLTIGCHTGLSVPAVGSIHDQDLAQVFVAQGITYIGPTAYGYALSAGIGYSEQLANDLTHQLFLGDTPTVGQALIQTKQHYFAGNAGSFDHLDEKVLLSLTLYGFPMLQVTKQVGGAASEFPESVHGREIQFEMGLPGVLTATLTGLTFNRHTSADGIFFDYAGSSRAQEGRPIQPALQLPVTATWNNQSLQGILLQQATYTQETSFNPLMAQSWAIGSAVPSFLVEPPVTFVGWDRDLPYSLGLFDGLSNTITMLSVIPGRYNADTQVEQLFDGFVFELLYGDGTDQVPPALLTQDGYLDSSQTEIEVIATDDTTVARVVAVCDDSQGAWTGVALTLNEGVWTGSCPFPAARFYVQLADAAGNVTTGPWSSPAAMAPVVSISRSAGNVELAWNHAVQHSRYQVWRSSEPYFEPGDPGTSQLAELAAPAAGNTLHYVDSGAGGDGSAYYYLVVAANDSSQARSNRVGKFVISVLPGWNLLAWPLLPADTTLDGVLGDQLYGTEDPLTADRVMVWNVISQTYETAFYCGGPVCESWGEPYANHWLANDYAPSPLTLESDTGFWLENRSGLTETLVVVGVVAEADRTIAIGTGWQMVGSAFPVNRLLDEANLPATGSDSPLTADRVLYWDAASQSYQVAWYCAGPVCESWGEPYVNHWLANSYSPSDMLVPPGYGFWYQNRYSSFTWVNPVD